MALVNTPVAAGTIEPAATSYEDFLAVLDSLRLAPRRIVIDVDRRRVSEDGHDLALTRQEFALLAHLALAADRIVSRDELIDTVWAGKGLDASSSRTVDAHVRRLRAKLGEKDLISTVRGEGYRFNSSPTVIVRAARIERAAHLLAA